MACSQFDRNPRVCPLQDFPQWPVRAAREPRAARKQRAACSGNRPLWKIREVTDSGFAGDLMMDRIWSWPPKKNEKKQQKDFTMKIPYRREGTKDDVI